jgi:sulfite oxidase
MGPKVDMIWGTRRDMIVRDQLPFDAEPPGSALAGRGIGRVDVLLDEGRTWRQADLPPVISQWTWRLRSLTVEAHPGAITVTARAWDDTGVTQPESPAPLWNPRGGYGNNAWAHVKVFAR